MRTGELTRRKVLRLSAAGGVLGLAGCTNGDGESSDGGSSDGGTSEGGSEAKVHCTQSSAVRVPAALSLGGVPTVRSATGGATSATAEALSTGQQSGGVPLDEVPAVVHRRAVEHVERLRGTDAAPEWEDARLRDVAYRHLRFDLDGVAYYEFVVDPAGFVVVPTGDHDFPVAHWSHTKPPVSGRLEALAREAGRSVARRYKLDTLAYAAEDDAGERVATVGPPVFRIEGMRPEWIGDPPTRRTAVAPAEDVRSDAEVDEDLEYTVEESGEAFPIEVGTWESWPALKEGYAESYAVLHEALRRAAAEEWAARRERLEQGIEVELPHRVVLLSRTADVDVALRGEGARVVEYELTEREGLPPVLELFPSTDIAEPVPLTVGVFYPDGRREEFRFLVTGAPGTNRMPDVGLADAIAAAVDPDLAASAHGPCSAGSATDQRLYHPNVSGGCSPGPGAVAWALLYGWADHQACLDVAPWTAHWGLYRQGGGKAPAPDEDAPRTLTTGTENVLEELQKKTGVCAGTPGETNPNLMGGAESYVIGRSAAAVEGRSTPLVPRTDLEETAIRSICDRDMPAVVGTGGAEYVLAWQYLDDGTGTQFCVNQGEGAATDWIPTGTTNYCGVLCPDVSVCNQVWA